MFIIVLWKIWDNLLQKMIKSYFNLTASSEISAFSTLISVESHLHGWSIWSDISIILLLYCALLALSSSTKHTLIYGVVLPLSIDLESLVPQSHLVYCLLLNLPRTAILTFSTASSAAVKWELNSNSGFFVWNDKSWHVNMTLWHYVTGVNDHITSRDRLLLSQPYYRGSRSCHTEDYGRVQGGRKVPAVFRRKQEPCHNCRMSSWIWRKICHCSKKYELVRDQNDNWHSVPQSNG